MAAFLDTFVLCPVLPLNAEGEARAESGGGSSRQAGGMWQPDTAPGLVLSTLYLAMEWILQAAPANRSTTHLACIRHQLQHVDIVFGPQTLPAFARTKDLFVIANILLGSAQDTVFIDMSGVPCSCQGSAVGHRLMQLMTSLKHWLG